MKRKLYLLHSAQRNHVLGKRCIERRNDAEGALVLLFLDLLRGFIMLGLPGVGLLRVRLL